MAHDLTSTVDWPEASVLDEYSAYRDSGEGGLMVYAVWSAYMSAPSSLSEVSLDFSEVFVSAHGPLKEAVDRSLQAGRLAQRKSLDAGLDQLFSSVVLIGSTDESFYTEQSFGGTYFQVTRDDLSSSGLKLVETLEALYGEAATLVTFLDT